MKEFISGIAMLLLLCVFLAQFTTNQITHDKLLFVQNDIEASLQQVKQDGYFTTSNKNTLTENLRKDLRKNSSDGISISSSKTTPVIRGQLIDYTITIKVENVYSGGKFFGISNSNNSISKTYSGYVSSEWIG